MGCGINFKVTPYFFENENTKIFFYFFHFLFKEKSFKKNNFFYFYFQNFIKISSLDLN
tara:strand:- start:2032 stop:2205 length:174 start_codon:yes stop_codon:yes gene_type:complete